MRDRLLVLPSFAPTQRVFGVVHWGNFDRLGTLPGLRTSVRRMMDRVEGVVFLDRVLANACAGFIPDTKRWVVPNTVDNALIALPGELDYRRTPRPQESPLRVLFFSNMLPEKGYDDVLEAVGHLHRAGTTVEATFAGAWPTPLEAGRFESLVAEQGIGAVVRYLGAVHDRSAIRRVLLEHDVLAFPSRYPNEAQPLVLIEAFACGLPVVTTPNGAIASMVEDGVEGRLVPSQTPLLLAAALDAYRNRDTWAAASYAARSRFDRQFSPDAVRAAWKEVLTR